MKKIILFFLSVLFFSNFNLAYAEIIINEVQLSPTEGRFLELYNTGDEAIDLSNWYMQRKTATGDSFISLVSKPNFEGKIIGAHNYFVISRNSLTSSNLVLDNFTLTESNIIQIKNSNSEEVVGKIGWGNSTDCGNPCPANPSEGKSIQKIGTGSWVVAIPTPGIVNESAIALSVPTPDPNNSSSIANTTDTKIKIIEIPKIKTQIITKTLSFVGMPLFFEGKALGYNKEELYYGKYFWNFGDGDSKEVKIIDRQKFSHTYFYPGEYNVTLEYYSNYYGNIPDASDKIIIKIVPADFLISGVGEEKDFFVELSNNTNYDADISNWILAGNNQSFIFPKNTILGSKKKIIFSSKITHFSVSDKNNLKLLNPQGELIFDYSASVVTPIPTVPIKTIVPPKIKISISQEKINSDIEKPLEVYSKDENKANSVTDLKIPVEDFLASAVSSDVVKDNPIRAYVLAFVSTVFIGASAGAVYFIRKKKIVSNVGDDFKILDE